MAAEPGEEGEGKDDEGPGFDKLELKKFIKLAKGKPLPWAFYPGDGKRDPVFAMHRRLQPDMLRKTIRKDAKEHEKEAEGKAGKDMKFGSGTLSVKDGVLEVAIGKVVPGIEKKFRKMLREMKIPMKVEFKAGGGGEDA